ncbi:MAG: Ig-like domain-containing protein [Cyanobacteria bacterium J06626_18]
MTTPTNDRVILYAMDPRRTPSDRFETPITDAEGNVLPEAKQYKVSTGNFLVEQDQVFWGDIQISATAANGDRGIVKSTHDLLGVKSYTYAPGNFNKAKLDNALNYMPDEGGTEIISLDFPGAVNEVTLILALLDNDQEQVQWQAFDKAGNVIDEGILKTRDGTQIDALDSEELNFGEDTTYEFNLPTASIARLELSALEDTGYSLAGIGYTPDDGIANAGPAITSAAAANVVENQTFAIDVAASDDADFEGAGLTYAITGGADADLFDIDAATGVVTFTAAPDFGNPADADADNTYDLQVTVTDSEGLTDAQAIAIAVTETPTLTLTLDTPSIAENGGTATATITRNTPTSDALTVTLSSSDTSEATVPTTVVIPAGQTSATFTVTGVDDAIADGTQTPTITATTTGFTDSTAALAITDDETAALSLSLDADSITEQGGVATATVSRNTPTDEALTVALSSSDTGEATVPNTVVIAAGQTSATFAVTAVDDTLVDGTQTATIAATTTGLTNSVTTLDITDDEVPALSLSLDSNSIVENGGTAIATVTRDGDRGAALTVNLNNDDPTATTVPAAVVIPAGEATASFSITGVDDAIADGTQTSAITASALGLTADTVTLAVTDDETATLTLTAGATSIAENGGSTTVTVTRNTPTTEALEVTLGSDDVTAATVPSTVVIPAGQAATTFVITGVDDSIADGMQTPTITASASDFAADSVELAVTDDEVAALTLDIDTASIAENGGTATASVTRNTATNTDLTVTLSSSDTSEATVPATVVISAGQQAATFTVIGVDDLDVDGPQIAVISASASGLTGSTVALAVTDDDEVITREPIRIEAEDIAVTTTYRTENIGAASGNQVLSLRGVTKNEVGSATFDFAGPTGTYTLVLGTFDEEDGEATFTVTQNGNSVGDPILLNQSLGSRTPKDTTKVAPVVATGVSIAMGDRFTITGFESCGEHARLDFIEFQFEDAATNTAQIAGDDTVTTDEDTPLTGNVLTNDNDADGDPLTVTAVNGTTVSIGTEVELASGALLTLNADGSFSYVPNDQFEFLGVGETAIDSFDYTVSDGQGFSTATATVTIEGAEEPALDLTLTVDSLAEKGGTTTATVTRTGRTETDVTVALTSSDLSEVAVPDTVVIAAGQTAATFQVSAVDDAIADGAQTATITASATGLTESAVDLTITDDDQTVSEPEGILLALNQNTTLNRLDATVQDIIQFDGTNYSLFFDGSDVGIAGAEINAFDAISDTEILLSFDNPIAIAGLGTVDDSDIVKFTATSLGENTAGSFSLVFDGSDLGLSSGGEDIDGLVGLSNGDLLISVNGNLNPGSGAIAANEDVVLFTPTSTGATTAGNFALFADGSDVGLSDEDIDAFGTDTSGDLYISFTNSFTTASTSGQDEDVAIFAPASTGENTSGSFDSELFLDGSQSGLQFRDVQGLDLTFTAV